MRYALNFIITALLVATLCMCVFALQDASTNDKLLYWVCGAMSCMGLGALCMTVINEIIEESQLPF